jgi:hypothetical protein
MPTSTLEVAQKMASIYLLNKDSMRNMTLSEVQKKDMAYAKEEWWRNKSMLKSLVWTFKSKKKEKR